MIKIFEPVTNFFLSIYNLLYSILKLIVLIITFPFRLLGRAFDWVSARIERLNKAIDSIFK